MSSANGSNDLYQVMFLVDKYIASNDWHAALAHLLTILVLPSDTFKKEELHLLKRMARLFAEINGALSNDDEKKQAPAAVQLLVLAKVKASEWLGTQGVAAMMLKKEYSPIGDVVMNPSTCAPLLIQADNYCVACCKPNCTTRCSGCKNVYYCSPEHQNSDWRMHKMDCAKSRSRGTVLWNDTSMYEEKMKEIRDTVEASFKSNE